MSALEELIVRARDARDAYENAKPVFRMGGITLGAFMELKAKHRTLDIELRKATRRGVHAQIERDLKKKYAK